MINKKQLILIFTLLAFTSEAFAICLSRCRAKKRAERAVDSAMENNSEALSQSASASQASSVNNDFSGSAAASDSDLTGTLSMVSGVAAIGYGVSQVGPCMSLNWGACALMAMSFAQAGSMFNQGGSAYDTRDALSGTDFDWSNPDLESIIGDGLDDGGTGTLDALLDASNTGNSEDYLNVANLAREKMQEGLAALEENGMTFNSQTGELFDKNGNKINPTGGVPASLTKRLDEISNKLNKKNDSRKLVAKAGAGGGGLILSDPFDDGLRKPASLDDGKKKKDFLAGLSKNAKGGIGVEGDDIFEMMTRRYSKKIKSKEFILKNK